ncbi:MAG: DUF4292 domain-containing protein [Bacteroidales bacterium]|jgi:hypothetical protein|nr:DUF4292 domain-containing protein [Bacteroidales bacterium]
MKKWFLPIIMTILLVGCKVQKNAIKEQPTQTAFESCTAKISGTYKSIPFGGTLRMQKDSLIWMSVTGFGFEAMRLLLRQDSVFAIDKLQKRVLIGDYNSFEQQFGIPITYSIAQKVLLDTAINEFNASNRVSAQFIPQGVTMIDGFAFPNQITLNAKLNNTEEKLTIKFSSWRMNVPIDAPFSIPTNYKIIK